MKRKMMSLGILAMIVGMFIATPGASVARGEPDTIPCRQPHFEEAAGTSVTFCDMWRGNVPVYETTQTGFFDDNDVVGYLASAKGNWFECQVSGETFELTGTDVRNDYWAFTKADNGEWGWVPEVYFSGGGNFVPDAGLRTCPYPV